jgi:hypothetical protein
MRDAYSGSVVLPVMLVGGTVVVLAAMRPRNIATDVGSRRVVEQGSGSSRSLWVWPPAMERVRAGDLRRVQLDADQVRQAGEAPGRRRDVSAVQPE